MLVKPIGKCSVCDTPFPYRKSKLYCSNACKQKAYTNSVVVNELQSDSVVMNNMYSINEYESYTSEFGFFSLIDYLFLRRNLSTSATLKEINTYLNGLYYTGNFEETVSNSQAYKQFVEEFLANKYSIV